MCVSSLVGGGSHSAYSLGPLDAKIPKSLILSAIPKHVANPACRLALSLLQFSFFAMPKKSRR